MNSKTQDYCQYDYYDNHNSVFFAQECHGTFMDVARDFLHSVIACVLLADPACEDCRNDEGYDTNNRCNNV